MRLGWLVGGVAGLLACQTGAGDAGPDPSGEDAGRVVVRVDGGGSGGTTSSGGASSSGSSSGATSAMASSSGGSTSSGGGGSSSSSGGGACVQALPTLAPVRLLTRVEFNHAVEDLLGDTSQPAAAFPQENMALGFENNAESHRASPVLVEAYLNAAESIASRAVTQRLNQVLPCAAQASTVALQDACALQLFSGLGRRAYRRPLTTSETQVMQDLFTQSRAAWGFNVAVELVITALLQSPQFLYRIHQVHPGEMAGARVPLDGFEVASRLSFLLWGSIPDETLLQAAQAGQLGNAAGVLTQVRRMLAHPKAKDAIRDFNRQYLGLDRMDHMVRPVPMGMDMMVVAQALKSSLYAFMEDVSLRDGDVVAALLTSSDVYLDGTLSQVLDEPIAGTAMQRVNLPPGERSGLLSQPGLMALLAHSDQTSPIHRGIFVREKLLCQTVPPPPANLVITAPSVNPNATTRERFAQHTAPGDCRGCHELIDPIGFGFEHYDELGRFRSTENGLPVDATGELLYTVDPAVEGAFDGVPALSARLVGSSEIPDCLVKQWYRFAHGRGEAAPEDACNLGLAQAAFRSGRNIKGLMETLATQDGFLNRLGQVPDAPPPIVEPDAGMPQEVDAGVMEAPDAGPPGDPTPSAPMGFVDSVSRAGLVSGWALDKNQPLYPLGIETWLDGPPGTGTYLFPVHRADLPRADVNSVTGWPGNHGFTFLLPQSTHDGMPHTLYVVANDAGSDGNTILTGSPFSFTVGAGNRLPSGVVDTIAASGNVNGWAYDPDAPEQAVTLEFSMDLPSYAGGTVLGTTVTGMPRPDVNAAFGITATAGWTFNLPAAARDGQRHLLFTRALDLTEPGELFSLCSDTAMSFQVSP